MLLKTKTNEEKSYPNKNIILSTGETFWFQPWIKGNNAKNISYFLNNGYFYSYGKSIYMNEEQSMLFEIPISW